MRVKTLHKTDPWYGAGKVFGWKGAGLGIDARLLDHYDVFVFYIATSDRPYYITKEKVEQILSEYMSFKTIRGEYTAIIPFSSLTSNPGEVGLET